MQKHCVFDEHPRRKFAWDLQEAPRTSKGQERKIFRSKDDQKDANILYEMPGKTSYSSLRRFCQKSANLGTNVNHVIKWVVRAYVSRVGRLSSLRRSSRLHVARQKFSSLLDKPDEKTSSRDSIALTFHSVISSICQLSHARKIRNQTNILGKHLDY